MARAAAQVPQLLAFARRLAVTIARRRDDRCCTADDVAEALAQGAVRALGRQQGIVDFELGNAAGSLFLKRDGWLWTGQFIKSVRPGSHQNLLRVWRLKDQTGS